MKRFNDGDEKCIDCDIGYFFEIVDSASFTIAQCSVNVCDCVYGKGASGSSCVQNGYYICDEEGCDKGFEIMEFFDVFNDYTRKICKKTKKGGCSNT